MDKNSTETAKLLQREIDKKKRRNARKAKGEKAKPRGKPFVKGKDDRRATGHEPRTKTLLRGLILDLFMEIQPSDNDKKTRLEIMLREWLESKDYNKQIAAVQYGYGKVEDETRNLSLIDDFILQNMDLFTDGQIQRINNGEDKALIVSEVLHSATELLKKQK